MSNESAPLRYETILISDENTVVTEYLTDDRPRETAYQTEAELEKAFIEQLKNQGYEYLTITGENELQKNLRRQLEKLNNITFTDDEWSLFFNKSIASANDSTLDKTRRIQEDYVQNLKRKDGSIKNIYLIDKTNIHNNSLQVINQYEARGEVSGQTRVNRYDVTILVNGLPMVHIELKRRNVDIRNAFNQINRYQRESFSAKSRLFEYVQIFVISNGTLTKYYSNTLHNPNNECKSSDMFSFTQWWADAKNNHISDIIDFTKTFFSKHTILNILIKYCVFDTKQKLLVMRPYQITAVERILQRIKPSIHSEKWLGTPSAGGYIWHTTGSGKTLTSFKVAQLAIRVEGVDKVLFVVDRKDLDYQTLCEYDRFEKGAANSNTSTNILQKQIEDKNTHIIITTIQKLSRFVDKYKKNSVYDKRIIIIFDECHRSQFGDMHTKITRFFKKHQLFGFTGTPIFAENANNSAGHRECTTHSVFGDELHTYTIIDAIKDKNVLPFRIDYIDTIKALPYIEQKKVLAIDTEQALLDPNRISQVVSYIIQKFDRKTKRNENYNAHGRQLTGFNSLFATASIKAAQRYYAEFTAQQKLLPPSAQQLKVALIYSFTPNENDDECFEIDQLDKNSRDFLGAAIQDYNRLFKTEYDTSTDKFENYYKDLSMRLKNRELDILIVVNMFLTGFDAATLNTLWLDKSLKSHGLIQAYSRTNRILNSAKKYGNIVSFRNLEQETNDALTLFSRDNANQTRNIVILKPYAEYYKEYQEKINEMKANDFRPDKDIIGETSQKLFIKIFGELLRLKNILTAFDDFYDNPILSERDFQDYQSRYLDLYDHFRGQSALERENINEDLVFEIELIKQVEINVDYLLALIADYLAARDNDKDNQGLDDVVKRAIGASPSLRDKEELVRQFVDSLSTDADVMEDWRSYIEKEKQKELERLIIDEDLKPEKTREFIKKAFQDGVIQTKGTGIRDIMMRSSNFSPEYEAKKQNVVNKITDFLAKYSF